MLDSNQREISLQEGRKLSRELNEHLNLKSLPHDPYFETSSLNNQNVQEVFEYIFNYSLPLSADQKKRYRSNDKSVIDLLETSGEGQKKCNCWLLKKNKLLVFH